MGDEVCPIDRQRVEHAGDIVALGFLVVTALWPRRKPHPAQVGHDHGMVAGEFRREGNPHVTGLAVTVEKDCRRSLAADPHMQSRAVRQNVLSPEFRRKRPHLCSVGHERISTGEEPRPFWRCWKLSQIAMPQARGSKWLYETGQGLPVVCASSIAWPVPCVGRGAPVASWTIVHSHRGKSGSYQQVCRPSESLC